MRSHLIDQGPKLEETLPRMPEWKQTAEDQETRAKMIRMMSDDRVAYRKFVAVLEKLEDQGEGGVGPSHGDARN